jgi:hypothetical protein
MRIATLPRLVAGGISRLAALGRTRRRLAARGSRLAALGRTRCISLTAAVPAAWTP